MGRRRFLLSVIAGSMLMAWLGWPSAEPVQSAVDIGATCSQATREWAEAWGRVVAPDRVVRVSVLCQADGSTYAATFLYSASRRGPRLVSWRPVTTFFEALPPQGTERVDTFDQAGRLVEYATVDRNTGRVEFYSAASRPTGDGMVNPGSGWVERFGLDGDRRGRLMLPIPPAVDQDG